MQKVRWVKFHVDPYSGPKNAYGILMDLRNSLTYGFLEPGQWGGSVTVGVEAGSEVEVVRELLREVGLRFSEENVF